MPMDVVIFPSDCQDWIFLLISCSFLIGSAIWRFVFIVFTSIVSITKFLWLLAHAVHICDIIDGALSWVLESVHVHLDLTVLRRHVAVNRSIVFHLTLFWWFLNSKLNIGTITSVQTLLSALQWSCIEISSIHIHFHAVESHGSLVGVADRFCFVEHIFVTGSCVVGKVWELTVVQLRARHGAVFRTSEVVVVVWCESFISMHDLLDVFDKTTS